MKKRKSPSSSCSSNSSSSSPVGSETPHELKKPKIKRLRNNQSPQNIQNADSPNSGKRSSVYRGVTRHRWTGRYEAHLWDKTTWNNSQNKKGRQVYLGAYDNEEAAARTYDLAALKYWGPETTLNFPIDTYKNELEEMQKVTREEYLATLRRRSSGFSRGVSKYRGVARHHHNGRWEARIGRIYGNKYLYLGTYNTQEEAAAAYDMAAIEYRGPNAVTNFDISNYIESLKKKGIFLEDYPRPTLPVSSGLSEAGAEVEQPPSSPPLPPSELDQPPPPTPPEVEQPPPLPVLHQAVMISPELEYPHDLTSTLDSGAVDEQDLGWSFFMDEEPTPPPFPVPDFSVGYISDLPDVFDDISFEDDIGSMFDEVMFNEMMTPTKTEIEAEYVSENTGTGVEMCGGGKEEKLTSSSSSSSPSNSSTTTSVSCAGLGY